MKKNIFLMLVAFQSLLNAKTRADRILPQPQKHVEINDSHLFFSNDEVKNFFQKYTEIEKIELPTEFVSFINNRLINEKVYALSFSLDSTVGNLFKNQPYTFKFFHKNESEDLELDNVEMLLDWKKINMPLAYTVVVGAVLNNPLNSKNSSLSDGFRVTFPMPSSLISVTELCSHIKDTDRTVTDSKLYVWIISLGTESNSNFLNSGELRRI